ncbi:MAG: amidase family protein, partial [Alphaproteobacteria bacterium]|nr:amidase family protein [Alphaproteobacteria bacterium]
HNMAALRNTMPGNMLDLCGLSIPAGLDGNGMPVGLQLLVGRGKDEWLISIGLAVEAVIGPASRRLGTPPGK